VLLPSLSTNMSGCYFYSIFYWCDIHSILSNIAHWRQTNKLIRKHDYINVYDYTSTSTSLSRAQQKTIYIYVLSCLKSLLSRFLHVMRCKYILYILYCSFECASMCRRIEIMFIVFEGLILC